MHPQELKSRLRGVIGFAPQFCLAVYDAGVNGRWAELHELVATTIRPFAKLRTRRPGYMIAVIKDAMNLLGLPGGCLRSPLQPVEPADRADLERELRRAGLLTT
jgi:5-dehydro-4-deoxyglucarate dehydratase